MLLTEACHSSLQSCISTVFFNSLSKLISRFERWKMSDIFLRDFFFTMENKLNSHTDDFLKRQAKKIKKDQNISHIQALDVAAVELGFSNYKNFTNSRKISSSPKTGRIQFIPKEEVRDLFISKTALDPYRNLLIAGTNELLKSNFISLHYSEDETQYKKDGYLLTEIFGFPSVVIWRETSFEEIIISVWWKYNHKLHPQAELTGNSRERFTSSSPLAKRSQYKKFVGITATAWLERKDGKYLMGQKKERIIDVYTRKGEKTELQKMPQQSPLGYETEGKFYF